MEIKSDIEIAQSCEMKNIREIAATAGVDEKYLEMYGNYKAKVDVYKRQPLSVLGHGDAPLFYLFILL